MGARLLRVVVYLCCASEKCVLLLCKEDREMRDLIAGDEMSVLVWKVLWEKGGLNYGEPLLRPLEWD